IRDQSPTTSKSETRVTVKPHPGPSFDCEPSQTHSLEGGPDDLLSRPQPVEARHLEQRSHGCVRATRGFLDRQRPEPVGGGEDLDVERPVPAARTQRTDELPLAPPGLPGQCTPGNIIPGRPGHVEPEDLRGVPP